MDYRIVPQANTMQQLQDNVSELPNDPATTAKYSKMKSSCGSPNEARSGSGRDR